VSHVRQRRDIEILFVELDRCNLDPSMLAFDRTTRQKMLVFEPARMSNVHLLHERDDPGRSFQFLGDARGHVRDRKRPSPAGDRASFSRGVRLDPLVQARDAARVGDLRHVRTRRPHGLPHGPDPVDALRRRRRRAGAGRGWARDRSRAGDVVWFAIAERYWHGTLPASL
jgi:hypothetical protein